MSNRVLYDGAAGVGTHAIPFQHGPTVGFYDCETRSKLYTITTRVRASVLAIKPIGSLGPLGGWLVEISEPRHIGAGLLEWEYTFAYLPPARITGATVVFNIQQIIAGDDAPSILEFPTTTSAVVKLTYWHTADPSTIPQLRAWRATIVNNVLYYLGTQPTGNGLALAEDSRIREWKPMIYERSAIYVTPASFIAQS